MNGNACRESDLRGKLERFESTCREAGLRFTHQRTEIYRELARACDHPSAEMIFQRVRQRIPMISLDTVYRTLMTFEQHGLVYRLQVSQDQARFEPNMHPHQHFVCRKCNKIEDFSWDVFEEMDLSEEARGLGVIEGKYVILTGVCRDCIPEGRDNS